MNQIKIHILFILICLTVFELKAQSGVAISTSGDQDPNSSAILELIATDKGLLIPRMTEVQRDAITVGASQDGLVIFNTDNGRFEYYRHSETTWVTIEPATLSGSGTGSEITFWSGSGASTTLTSDPGLYYLESSTFLGVGTSSPLFAIDAASGTISSGDSDTGGGLVLHDGQGSNYEMTILPGTLTEDITLTFPSSLGSDGQSLITDSNGDLIWSDPAVTGENITINDGEDGNLTFRSSGTLTAADGLFYDNSTSYFGAGINPPESSLHGSGTITAGTTSTQGALVLHDGNGQKLTVYPADMTSDVSLTMPADAGTQGYVLTTDGNGVMSWTNQPELDESAINVSGEDGGLLFNNSGTMTTADGITYDNSNTYFGIGTGSPSYPMDVSNGVISSGSNGTDGGLRLFSEQGGTDYDLFFAPNPAMTQSTTYTFPIDDGDANEFLQTDGSGNLSWEIPTLDASNITINNGTDGGLMYNNSGTMNNADGIFYDNSTSFFGAGIDPPESSLHGSGTITAGTTSTEGALVLHDGNGQKLTVYPADMTSDVSLTMPADAGTQGYVLTTDGNGVMSWTNQPELDESAINVSGEDGGLLFNNSGTMTTADGITYDNSNTYFGIGTGSPSYPMDVSNGVISSGSNGKDGGLRLYSEQGGTDYDLFFAPNPAMTQSTTYTFPIDDGDANEFLQTDGSGNLSWEIPTLDASNITINNGTDGGLMYNNSGTMANADGIVYNNSNSYLGVGVDPAESSLHASGTITAGTTSTQGALVLHDGNGQKLTVYPADMTSDVSLTMPADAGTQGYVLTTDGNGVMSWTNQPELDESAINVSGEDGGLLFNNSGTMTTADGITYDNSNTYFGIGTSSPSYPMDVANGVISSGSNGTDGGLRLFSEQGGTDYDLFFAPNPAMTQSTTYTFPIDDGDANEFLQTDGSGNLSWEIPTLDASNITINNGTDGGLMYNNSGTMNNADGIFYDNSTSFFGAGIDPPESSLHGSGTITAGTTSTQGALVLHDGNGQKLTVYPADMTSDVSLTMPADAGTQGYVLTTDGNGVMSWTNQPELDESAINVSGEDGGLLFNNSGTMTTADGITYDNSNTYFGIGTGSPSYPMDVSNGVISSGSNGKDGGLRLYSEQGGTDYDLFFAPNPAMTQSTTYTFPIDDGDANEFLQTDGSGNLSWEIPTLDASNITINNGTDGGLMYNNSGTMNNADGIFYDNSTSFFGAGIDPPESSLHGSGTITAGTTSTQGALVLHDGNGQKLTVYPADMTSDVSLTMPADAGTQGYVLTTDGNGVMSWTNQPELDESAINVSGEDGGLLFNNSGTMTTADGITYDNSNTYFGIGTGSPSYPMDVSNGVISSGSNGKDGGLRLYSEQGGTDYDLFFAPNPAMTQSTTYTFPIDDGDANEFLQTDGSGNLSWEIPTLDASNITINNGTDGGLMYNNSGTMANADGIVYNNSNSYLGVGVDPAESSLHASGTITAGTTSTQGALVLHDGNGQKLTVYPADMTSDVSLTMPADAGTQGYVLTTDGNGVMSWTNQPELDESAINVSGEDGGLLFNNSGTMTTADGITYDNSNTYFGIGTSSPSYPMDVANGVISSGSNGTDGGLRLFSEQGGTDYDLFFAPNPAMTQSTTYTFPIDDGDANEFLQTDGSGNLSWEIPTLDASNITINNGTDGGLMYNNSGTMNNADGIFYDNSTSFFGAGIDPPESSLHGSGTITAGTTSTEGALVLHDGNGQKLTVYPADMTSDVSLTMPADAGTQGYVLTTDGNGVMSWTNQPELDESAINVSGEDGGLLFNNSGTMTTADGITYDNSNTYFGIGTGSPSYPMDVSNGVISSGSNGTDGGLRLYSEQGGTDYDLFFAPNPAMTQSTTYTFPIDDGDANEFLQTDGSGNLSWETPTLDASNITINNGTDGGLMYNNSGTMNNADGIFYDNSTSFFGAGIDPPESSLHGSGTITAGTTSTEGALVLHDGNGQKLTVYPADMTSDVSLTMPADAGTQGYVLTTDGNGVMSWTNQPELDESAINVSGEDGGLLFNNSGTMTTADGITYDNSNTYFGIGTGSPSYPMDVSNGVISSGSNGTDGGLRLFSEQGGTDYDLFFAPNPAMTQSTTYTFPIDDGDANEFLQTDGSGNLSWEIPTLDASNITINNGTDGGLMYNNSGTMNNADGIFYDNSTSYFGAGINPPESSLHGSGTITAGTTSNQGALVLHDGNGQKLTVYPGDMTSDVSLVFPLDDGDANEFLQTDGSGNLSWEIPTLDASNITINNGTDGGLMYNNSGTMNNADGIFYDNSTSFFGAGVDPPESSLHGSGTITAGTTSNQGALVLHDGNGQKLTVYPADMTSDVSLTMPADAGTQGYVLTTDGNGVMSWTNQPELDESAINVSGEDGGLLFNNSGTMTTADGITYDNSNTYFGIGTGSPSYPMDVSNGVISSGSNGTDGGLRLYSEQGGTDYDLFFAPNPAMTQSTTYTFPIDDGDANEFLQTDGSGNLSWEIPTLDASNITINNGTDGGMMYNNSGTMANADGIVYNNSNSYLGVGVDPAESSLHASGTVTAGTTSNQGALVLHDGNGQKLTVYPADMTSDISLTMPADAGTQGYVLTTDGNGVMSWTNQPELDESAINVSGEDGGLLFNNSGTMTTADGITYDNSNTYFGIGTGSPSYPMDVSNGVISSGSNGTDGGLRLYSEQGGTDYDLFFAPNPAMTQSTTYTFPIDDGDANEFLQTDGSGNLSWEIPTLDASNITINNGTDGGLMYNNSGTMNNADGIFYDNSTSYFGAGVDPPESSLHGSGTITAGTTSNQGALVLHDGNGQKLTVYPGDMTSDVSLVFPIDDGDANEFLQTDGSGNLSWEIPTLDASNITINNGTDGGLMYNNSGTMNNADGIFYDNSTSYFGAGVDPPESSLHGSGTITAGTTSNQGALVLHDGNGQKLTVYPGDMTSDVSLVFPIDDGDANEFLQTDGSGNLSWEIPTLDASNITINNGTDGGLMYNNSGTMNNADGIFYDNSTSFFGAGIDPPESSLHGSGTITAGTTSNQGALVLHDGNGQKLTVYPGDMTSDVSLVFPLDDGDANEFLQTDGSGNLSWEIPTLDASNITINNGTDGGLMYNNSGTMANADGIVYNNSNSYLGVGVSPPESSLHGSGTITAGTTSNQGALVLHDGNGEKLTIYPADMTSDVSLFLPADDGTANQVLTTDGSGNLTWEDAAGGDVSGSGSANQMAYWETSSTLGGTGLYYDNSNTYLGIGTASPTSALDVASGTITTGDNTTAGGLVINDGSSNHVVLQASALSSNYTLTLPQDDGTNGQVLTTDGSGSLTWTSAATAGVIEYSTTSPGSYGSDQNNLTLASIGDNTIYRIQSSTAISITGIDNTDVNDGKQIILINVGSNLIQIKNDNSGSSASNRIYTGGFGSIFMFGNGSCTLVYDASSSRWRVISSR